MLRRSVVLVVLCLALGFSSLAADLETSPRQSKKLWWTSVAILGAATALDAQSSWGKQELNPLLRNSQGTFGARGAAMKISIAGAGSLVQWIVLRKHPEAQTRLAIINTAAAGAFTAAAIHNTR